MRIAAPCEWIGPLALRPSGPPFSLLSFFFSSHWHGAFCGFCLKLGASGRLPKSAAAQCPIRQPQHLWTSIQLCCPSIGRLSLRSARACVRMSHCPLCRVRRMRRRQKKQKQVETNNKPFVCKEASCGKAKTREICLGQCWV